MSRKKSGFLSAFGTANEILKAIIDAVLEKGGDDEDLRRILSSPDLPGKIAELIMAEEYPCFPVTVDCRQDLGQMIKAGKYDWTNSNITSDNFPIQGGGKYEGTVELIRFNRTMSSKKALEKMEKQSYRPARIEELLALGAAYPKLQKQFPIVALGSVWQDPCGGRNVPYLYWDGAGRRLSLGWPVVGWGGDWRLAVVRNA